MKSEQDTIFALASGQLPCAIAIIRISGSQSAQALAILTQKPLRQARQSALRYLYDAQGDILDKAMVVHFPAPHTATGEDVVELYTHGSIAVVQAVENYLATLLGLKRAQAGDFTRRAFLNGRMDLAQIEGLNDLLTAETEEQRRNAIDITEGRLSVVVHKWKTGLLKLSAEIEFILNMEEADGIDSLSIESKDELKNLIVEIAKWLNAPSVERLKSGITVILAGPPNAGKSSLFNALIQRNYAIISPIAGTTRDILEAHVNMEGRAFVIKDTAGLNDDTQDIIELEGVQRAQIAIRSADIILWLGHPDEAPEHANIIYVASKADIEKPVSEFQIPVSVKSQTGLDTLVSKIQNAANKLLPKSNILALHKRQRDLIAELHFHLEAAFKSSDCVLIAENFRRSCYALDKITGRVQIEDVLDNLFSQFCVGK